MNIAKTDFFTIASLLNEWLVIKNRPITKKIAVRTSIQLLGTVNPSNDSRRQAIIPLVKILLTLNENICQELMALLKSWINRSNNPLVLNDISDLLSMKIAFEDHNFKNQILHILEQDWSREKNGRLVTLANKLLAFYAAILETLITETVVIVLDVSDMTIEILKRMERFFIGITKQFDSFRLRYYGLGDCSSEQRFFLKTLIESGSNPNKRSSILPARLIGPILGEIDIDSISLVLVLTSGDIIDLEDWAISGWVDKILINQFRPNLRKVEGFKYIESTSVKDVAELIKTEHIL
jgi:hypothetical protein